MAAGNPGGTPREDNRKLEVTEALETDKGTFVVVGVQYQDNPETGEHENFTYAIKDPADIIADEEPEVETELSENEA